MQHSRKSEIRNEPLPTHMHEELLLQGMLIGSTAGCSVMLQGPRDILSAEILVATPAGLHSIVLEEENKRTVGNFRRWHRDLNPPTPHQTALIHQWDLCRREVRGANCTRQHRTLKEARSCTGVPKPVVHLSDLKREMTPLPNKQERSKLY